MSEKSEIKLGKKPYQKPMISQVELRPDEAVLGNCKVSGGAGPNGSNCSAPTSCSALGS